MTAGVTIEFSGLTKTFGQVQAVSDLSFTVEPGQVTGFLGPNGAGKTTTLRMLLGLVRPTSGTATFGGTAYRDLPSPLATVGAALEAASFHPGRSAANHLRTYAQAAGIDRERVQRRSHRVGLGAYGDRRVGGYSLGMRQRLGLAFALLGDPRVLVLDEPINGLDPEGIKWIRLLPARARRRGPHRSRSVAPAQRGAAERRRGRHRVARKARAPGVARQPRHRQSRSRSSWMRRIARSWPRPSRRPATPSARCAEAFSSPTRRPRDVGRIAFAAGIAVTALSQKRVGLEESFLHLVGEEGAL